MPEDFTSSFLDAYFKAHSQKMQAQQFAQELQLRQQAQGLQAQQFQQQFGLDQAKANDESDYRAGELNWRQKQLAQEAAQNENTNRIAQQTRDLGIANLASQGKGQVVPNQIPTGMLVPGAIGVPGIQQNPVAAGGIGLGQNQSFVPYSPEQLAQQEGDKQAELARQKSYSDIQDKLSQFNSFVGALPEDSALRKNPAALDAIRSHVMTGVAPPNDESVENVYGSTVKDYLNAVKSGDPKAIADTKAIHDKTFAAIRPYLQEKQMAALTSAGDRQTNLTDANTDFGEVLDEMTKNGVKAKSGEDYRQGVRQAAMNVNTRRVLSGKKPVDVKAIETLSGLEPKANPGKGTGLTIPITINPAVR